TSNVSRRFNDHLKGLTRQKHHSLTLQRAWNKYGADQFIFHILEAVPCSHLLTREQWYFDQFCPYLGHLGFNTNPVAGSRLGSKASYESRQLMRERALARGSEHLKKAWAGDHEERARRFF